jgi:hypothetical protein
MLLPANALNYQHLLYFWVVAREGSVAAATRELNLAQPTISGQLKVLERTLGERLFVRRGRHLVLTEVGQLVYRYATRSSRSGASCARRSPGCRAADKPMRFAVGVSDSLPKLSTVRLLHPALDPPGRFHLVFRIGKTEQLPRRPRRARAGPGARRRAGAAGARRARLPPPARRERGDGVRHRGDGGAPRRRLPALARRRAVGAADVEHGAPAVARPVVRRVGGAARA